MKTHLKNSINQFLPHLLCEPCKLKSTEIQDRVMLPSVPSNEFFFPFPLPFLPYAMQCVDTCIFLRSHLAMYFAKPLKCEWEDTQSGSNVFPWLFLITGLTMCKADDAEYLEMRMTKKILCKTTFNF